VLAQTRVQLHVLGEIRFGASFQLQSGEGLSCMWNLLCGKYWSILGGPVSGQTHVRLKLLAEWTYTRVRAYVLQVGYPGHHSSVVLNHPLDFHFATTSFSDWPRLQLEAHKLDVHGRRILCGYGFVHIPANMGTYDLEAHLWRPTGGLDSELRGDISSFYTEYHHTVVYSILLG
jgi:hypothetical protein